MLSTATSRRLLARLARGQVAGRLPSVVAGVVRDGEPVWFGAYGDLPDDVAPEDLQYRVGSITKTFTAVLVLQLVEDGLVGLDTPVGEVLGEVGYGDRTLRQLLAHASGMQSEPAGPWWERSDGVAWDDLAAAHDGSGAVWEPHRAYHYSNLGFALLGRAAARLTGVEWWDAVRERVLEPLGMTRTTYLPQTPHASGWSVHPYESRLEAEPATDTGAMAPAGQAWSTAADLARWAGFLLAGHDDVLPAAVLTRALAPQSGRPEDGLAHAHGLGFQLMAGGSGTLAGHLGSMPGFLAGCLVDRARALGAVLVTNATTGAPVTEILGDLMGEVHDSEPGLPAAWTPSPPVPDLLRGVPGVWHWGNTALVWAMEGLDLVVRRGGQEQYRFGVVGDRVVGLGGYHAGERLRVHRRPDGTVAHLEAATFVYTREPYDPAAPVPGR